MSRIKCSLVLSGASFEPEQIGQAIGCDATMSWKTGDLIAPSQLRRKECGWKLSVEEPASDDLEAVIEKLARLLEPKKAVLQSLIREHDLEVEVACAIYVRSGIVPSMHLNRDHIAFLLAYSAELDIDLYPNPVQDGHDTGW